MSVTMSRPSTAQSVWLVSQREIVSKLRSRVFVISTGILFALALVAVVWGGIAAQSVRSTPVAVTSETASVVAGMQGIAATQAPSVPAALAMVKAGKVDAALVPAPASGGAFDYQIVAKDSVPQALVSQLSQSPTVRLLEGSPADSILRYLVAIGFGIVFLMAASTFGGTIAQSVVEEKQTRVVELLISAIPVRTLLAGKVLGNTILAMSQIIGFAAIAIVGLSFTGQAQLIGGLGGPVAWFAVFFLFGFVLLASLFAAGGAMVSRQEDVGSTTAPLTLLVVAPYMLVILFNNNAAVLTVMSYVPFSAPVAMPMRLYLGTAQWWEPFVSLVLLIATCVGAILVAARIYRNSILRMGGRVTLSEALAG